MVFSQNRGTPIWTPTCYNPSFGTPPPPKKKGTPNFGNPPNQALPTCCRLPGYTALCGWRGCRCLSGTLKVQGPKIWFQGQKNYTVNSIWALEPYYLGPWTLRGTLIALNFWILQLLLADLLDGKTATAVTWTPFLDPLPALRSGLCTQYYGSYNRTRAGLGL